MRPIRIPSAVCAEIPRPPIEKAWNEAKSLMLGELETCDTKNWNSKPFFNALSFNYLPRKCRMYSPLDLICTRGSIFPHEDSGFGLVVCWLLKTEDQPYLMTTGGNLNLLPGGMCIFDANKEHAWLSNGPCVMLMATIKRRLPKSKAVSILEDLRTKANS